MLPCGLVQWKEVPLIADGYHYVVDSVTDATHLELSIVYAGGTLGAQSYNMYPCLQNETTADAYVAR
jgi:hypothetical protein